MFDKTTLWTSAAGPGTGSTPGQVHLKAERSTLAYLIGTDDKGVTYSRPALNKHVNSLYCWVDSDYAADPDTSSSVTGYLISMNNGPVSWSAKRQSFTMLSSAEAEFVAASMCGQEVIYLHNLLRDLGHLQGVHPTVIYEDNASCIAMSENPVNAERSSHIDTHLWFLHDMVWDGLLRLRKCTGTQNVADALTKSLQVQSFAKHSEYLFCSRIQFEAFYVSIGEWSVSTAGRAWSALQCSSVAAAV
eukprot:2268053-Rhodomonas_salina.1